MKGMSRTVITSMVREERLIQHIDGKYTYCRYERSKTVTTITKEDKSKVIRRNKSA